jgi:ATPase subunit of ABC transporter with duplicated ATPase domains
MTIIEHITKDLTNQCHRLEKSLLLRENSLSKSWTSLSGGERQRAAIACALLLAVSTVPSTVSTIVPSTVSTIVPPATLLVDSLLTATEYPEVVLLLDEPTAACDSESTLAVEQALVASGAAMIIITHDERQAKRLAHRRIQLVGR